LHDPPLITGFDGQKKNRSHAVHQHRHGFFFLLWSNEYAKLLKFKEELSCSSHISHPLLSLISGQKSDAVQLGWKNILVRKDFRFFGGQKREQSVPKLGGIRTPPSGY
jgi:hypothetical protein